jgi:hypothetical protein
MEVELNLNLRQQLRAIFEFGVVWGSLEGGAVSAFTAGKFSRFENSFDCVCNFESHEDFFG